jgi:hypothetical protein
MIFDEKIELKVYVNQHDPVSDIQTPSCSSFLLCFFHELLMSFHYNIIASVLHWHMLHCYVNQHNFVSDWVGVSTQFIISEN